MFWFRNFIVRPRTCTSRLFRRIAVLLSTGGVPERGSPTSSSWEERIWATFPHSSIWPSLLLQLQRYFCSRMVLCCWGSSKGTHRVFPYLLFQWRSDLFIGGAVERALGPYFISVAWGHSFTNSHYAVTWRNCIIPWGQCWGRFLCSSGGVLLSKRGLSPFPLRALLEEGISISD